MATRRGHEVALAFVAGGGWVCVRELTGSDEEWVDGRGTAVGIELLDRLLVAAPGAALGPGEAAQLTAADRDTLLAAVYAVAFGPRIEATQHCGQCAAKFDLDFAVPALVAGVGRQREPAEAVAGVFTLRPGVRFRLPSGADELAVAALAPERAERTLLERCLVEGDAGADGPAVIAAMERIAPTLDLELDARCPECGAQQPLRFDIQQYLVDAIVGERPRLYEDVHLLAAAYHWSLTEILSLRRTARRRLVQLVTGDATGWGRQA
jgi:hypothetical protein